jgi:hypothetical protein
MDVSEVVECGVRRNHLLVAVDLLGKRIGQARDAAHVHSPGHGLAFDVRRADHPKVGTPRDVHALMPIHSAGLYTLSCVLLPASVRHLPGPRVAQALRVGRHCGADPGRQARP